MTSMLPGWLRDGFVKLLRPIPRVLIRRGVHPNTITTLGFLFTVTAGVMYFLGHVRIGGGLVIIGGIFDILDGQVARGSAKNSVFGSFYDSTLDRISEILVFLGIFSLYGGSHPEFNSGRPQRGQCAARPSNWNEQEGQTGIGDRTLPPLLEGA